MKYAAVFLCFATLVFSLAPIASSSAAERTKRSSETKPFDASIRFMGHHRCSGAVIEETLVITAAECVQRANIDYLEVAVGLNKGEVHQVLHVAVHPLYDPLNKDYDFAIVKVEKPFNPEESSPINLANQPLNGTTSQPPAIFEWDNEKSEVHVHGLDVINCAAVCKTTDRMLCAEAAEIEGDIGAPMVYEGQLHGILIKKESHGQGPGTGVFARAYPYVNSMFADKMVSDPVVDKICGALRTIINALKNMPFIPSFIVSAVKYLANLLKCGL